MAGKEKMDYYEIVVVGGGPAGITLAKILGKKKKMAVIRPENYSMVYCAMPYAVEGILPVEKTFKKDDLVINAGAHLIRSSAEDIDFENKVVTLADGTQLRFDEIILATGAVPFLPPIPGIELEGVLGFKTENDMRTINRMVENGATGVVVVGAGAIGIELAQALNHKGLDVHLVDIFDSIMPNMVDAEMVVEAQREMEELGITMHLGSKVIGLEGRKCVDEVVFEGGDFVRFQKNESTANGDCPGIVVFAVGMRPVVSLVQDKGIEIGRDGIIVNDRLETNLPGVYAVGDCIQFHSGITGEVISGKLATNAVPMAKVLGYNLLGQDRRYKGYYNGAATKIGKYFVGGTGLSERNAKLAGIDVISATSEMTTKFPIMPGAKKIRLKLIADRSSTKLIGAQILSEEPVTDRIDLLTLAIQNELEIADLAALSYAAQPYQSYFPAANLVVVAADKILASLDQ